MTAPLFSEDTYTTPPGRESLLHRLLLRGRVYYICRFLYIVFRYWHYVRTRGLDFDIWRSSSYRVFQIMEACGGRFHISGLDNIRTEDRPVVFIANHMSTMETVVLPCIINPYKNPVFVIKEQLQKIPVFGVYVRDCIAVSRNSPSEDFKQVMSQGTAALALGKSIIIFPQSTRMATIDPEKFNTLGVKLARRAQVPVIPLALKTDFWGTGSLIKDFGPINHKNPIGIAFGKPMTINGSGKKEHEQITAFIREQLGRWEKDRDQ